MKGVANHRPYPISTNNFPKSEVLFPKSWLRSAFPFKHNRSGQKTLNPLSDYHRRSHKTQKQSSSFRWTFSIATLSHPIGIYIIKPILCYRPYRWMLRRLLIPEHRKNGRRKRKRAKRSERCRRHVSIRKNLGVAVRWGKSMDRRSKPGVGGKGLLHQLRHKGVKKRGSDNLGTKFSRFRWGFDHQPLIWKADSMEVEGCSDSALFDWRLVLCFRFVGLGRFCKFCLVSLAYSSKEGVSVIHNLLHTLRLPCDDKYWCLSANVWELEFALVWSLNWIMFFIWRLIKNMDKKFNEKVCDKKYFLLANVECSCQWCCYLEGYLNRFVGWASSHIFSLLVYYIGFISLECF